AALAAAKHADHSEDIKAFGVGSFGQSSVTDPGSPLDLRVKIVFVAVGRILGQASDLAVHVLLAYFNQEVWEESVAGAQHVKSQHGRTVKSAQRFFGDRGVILVDVRSRVNEYNFRSEAAVHLDHVLQNLLAQLWEAACLELSEDHI